MTGAPSVDESWEGGEIRVLLIEDAPEEVDRFRLMLRRTPGAIVDVAHSLGEGLTAALVDSFDVVLLDLSLPDSTGLQGPAAMAGALPGVPILVLTDDPDEKFELLAVQAGAQDCLRKDRITGRALRRVIRYSIERQRQASEQRRLNDELTAANRRLLDLDRAKSQFINILSHELRTPLHAMIGFAELIEQGAYGPINDGQRRATDGILRRGEDLVRLLDDVLDLSRIEAGRLAIAANPYDPLAIARRAFETAMFLVRDRDEKPTVRVLGADAPAEAIGDGDLYHRVVLNLLSNAVRFTPKGSVTVRIGARGGRFVTEVTDTGIGMTKEDLAVIFEEFRQTDGSSTRKVGGSGLGLTICKRLAALMDGKLKVESAPRKGTTFWLDLPLRGRGRAAKD